MKLRQQRNRRLRERLAAYTIGTDAWVIADWLETIHPSALTGEGGVKESSPARRSADVASAGTRAFHPASTSPPAVSARSAPGVVE